MTGASLLLARAELRRRLPSLLVLGLLTGIVAGVVLGAALGARRTGTAYDRLIDATSYPDAEAFDVPPALVDDVAALPMVTAAWRTDSDVGLVTDAEQVLFVAIQSGPTPPPGLYEPILVAGTRPDPAALDELLLSEQTSVAFDKGVGDTFDFAAATPEQFAGFLEGIVPEEPRGPQATFRVAGIVRDPVDALPSGQVRVLATPAWSAGPGADAGGLTVLAVRLAGGASDVSAFRDAVAAVVGSEADGPGVDVSSIHEDRLAVDRATSVAARTLLAFAAVAALAGAVAVGQALSRNLLATTAAVPTWSAVGLVRSERLVALLVPRVVVVAAAAVVAVVVAVAVSPLTPVGVGRTVEPDPGVDLAWGSLAVGAVAVVAVVGLVVVVTSIAQLRRSASPVGTPSTASSTVSRLVALGGSLPLVVGARFALEPGRGSSAVPTRSALVGAVLGVAGLVAAGTVLTSLDRLVTDPARYGWGHDATVVDVDDELVAELVADERSGAVVAVRQVTIELAGTRAPATGFTVRKGGLALPVLSGRVPAGPAEVALGPDLARRLGIGEGDVVEAPAVGGGTVALEVVGTVLTEDLEDFAGGVVLTAEGLAAVEVGDDGFRSAWLTWADGVDEEAATVALAAEKELGLPDPPAEVVNLSQARSVLGGLAAFLGALALVATGHAVLVVARRRRRELGVLRAVGVTGAQLGGAVRWMALVLLAAGLVAGVPVGLVTAGLVWGSLARSVGVAGDLAVPVLALATAVPVAAVAGLVLAAVPAHRAATVRAASALRAE